MLSQTKLVKLEYCIIRLVVETVISLLVADVTDLVGEGIGILKNLKVK